MLQRQTHKHHQILKTLFIKTKFFRFKGHQVCLPLTFILFYLLHVGFFFKTIYGLRRKIMPSEFKVLPRTVYQCFILCTQSINAFFFSWSQIRITYLSWAWGRNTACMMSWLITRNQMPCSQELCAWKQVSKLEEWWDPCACMDRQEHTSGIKFHMAYNKGLKNDCLSFSGWPVRSVFHKAFSIQLLKLKSPH